MISRSNKLQDTHSSNAPFADKRVRVNLHRRGIFRACVLGTCKVTPSGITITAETPLTQGRRCLSHFELTSLDVADMCPSELPEADFEIRLELESVEWEERIERLPLPRSRKQAGPSSYRRVVALEAVGTGEP